MNQYGNDWQVPPYQHLIPTLSLSDPDDRHVLAAAIAAKASVLVTSNIDDFPQALLSGYGIRVVRPDPFAGEMLSAEPTRFLRAVREHRGSLKNPPKTVSEYLSALEVCGLPQTAQRLKEDGERMVTPPLLF